MRPLKASTATPWRALARNVIALALSSICLAAPAAATPQQCQRAISGKFAKFVQQRMKLLQKCNEKVVIGKRPGPCPDFATTNKLARVASKFALAIDQKCGGPDKRCGVGVDE